MNHFNGNLLFAMKLAYAIISWKVILFLFAETFSQWLSSDCTKWHFTLIKFYWKNLASSWHFLSLSLTLYTPLFLSCALCKAIAFFSVTLNSNFSYVNIHSFITSRMNCLYFFSSFIARSRPSKTYLHYYFHHQ